MTNFLLSLILAAFVIFAGWMVTTKSMPTKTSDWTIFTACLAAWTFLQNILWPDIVHIVYKVFPDIDPKFVDEIINVITSFFS
jgi:hypothetical protein